MLCLGLLILSSRDATRRHATPRRNDGVKIRFISGADGETDDRSLSTISFFYLEGGKELYSKRLSTISLLMLISTDVSSRAATLELRRLSHSVTPGKTERPDGLVVNNDNLALGAAPSKVFQKSLPLRGNTVAISSQGIVARDSDIAIRPPCLGVLNWGLKTS